MRGAAGLLNLERQYNRVQLCNTSLPLTGCGTHHVAQSKGRLQLPHPAPQVTQLWLLRSQDLRNL